MFCDQCGQRLEPQSNFCSRCGHKIKPVAQQPTMPAPTPHVQQPVRQPVQQPVQPSTTQPDERVAWVFGATRKLSAFKVVACNMVFMRSRLVLAHLTPALQKAESARVSQEIKADGKGFFKSSAAMMRFWADYHKQYYDMPVQAILAQDASNMAVDYAAVSEVLFKCYSETTDYSDSSSGSVAQGKLHIKLTGGETIKFTHNQWHDNNLRQMLTDLFGQKLKYRK